MVDVKPKKKGFDEDTFLDSWDHFAAPAPTFNLNGKGAIGTWIGFTCTLLLTLMIGFFSMIKFEKLFGRENPDISSKIEERFYTAEDKTDIANDIHSKDNEYQIALRVINSKNEPRHDPAYVEW
jgi:hypothetical protein